MGLPIKDLYSTQPVLNTYEEAKAIKNILSEKITSNKPKIILVASAFHMQRAKKVFEREGINVNPYPVNFRTKRQSFTSILLNPFNWIPNP